MKKLSPPPPISFSFEEEQEETLDQDHDAPTISRSTAPLAAASTQVTYPPIAPLDDDDDDDADTALVPSAPELLDPDTPPAILHADNASDALDVLLGSSSPSLEATDHTGPTSPRLAAAEETHRRRAPAEGRPITEIMSDLATYPSPEQESTEQLTKTETLRLGLGADALAEATREYNIDLAQLQATKDMLLGKTYGKFRIIVRIGHGGFGTVYKAEHIELRQEIALKVLRISQQTEPEVVERFHREAQVMSRLSHKNIVHFYDFGKLQDVGFYLVMEYLQGKGLDRHLTPSKMWSYEEISHIVISLCDALNCVHERGLIHRDMKPSNIFLCRPTTPDEPPLVKLLDFGIAGLADGSSELTSAGSFLGTAQYVSPEQARGLENIDHRADIYSLGVILFRMLTGKLPFDAKTKMDIIVKHISQPIPTLAELASWKSWCDPLEQLIQTVLAKDPEQRPQSAQAFKTLCLEALQAQHGLESEDRTVVDGSQPKGRGALAASLLHDQADAAKLERSISELAPFKGAYDDKPHRMNILIGVVGVVVIILMYWMFQ